MQKHVNDLAQTVADTAIKVSTTPAYIAQARTINVLARTMIYARGHEARFKDRTPYFAQGAKKGSFGL